MYSFLDDLTRRADYTMLLRSVNRLAFDMPGDVRKPGSRRRLR